MKKNSVGNPRALLYNRYVLIFIFVLAVANVIQLATLGDYFTVAIFVLVGFLTTYFSKNMIVILTVSMVFANVIKYGTDLANPWIYEGFDGDHHSDDSKNSEKKKEPMSAKEKTNKVEQMISETKKKQEKFENGEDHDEDDTGDDVEEEFSSKKSKKQQKIEKDALDDLRHEMKLGFKRLNQNIDSVGMSSLFS